MNEEILAKLEVLRLSQDQLGQDVAGLRQDVSKVGSGMRQDFDGMRQDVNQEFAGLRQDVNQEFAGLRQDVKGLRLGQGHLLEQVEVMATRLEDLDKNLLDLRRTTTDSHEVLLALIQQRAS